MTERRGRATSDIDVVDTLSALRLVHEDARDVHAIVTELLPMLAPVVESYVACLRTGGTVHYFGAGSSGRIAAMDAAELPPTFGIAAERVVAHLAGGSNAALKAKEAAEDDGRLGEAAAASVRPGDLAIGLTASGTTAYVRGALTRAHRAGAETVLISNSDLPLGYAVDRHIPVVTGPEAIVGSTRLKAATAQKHVLNAVSTVAMVQLGRTYSNLMIALRPTNRKLRRRLLGVLVELSGRSDEEAMTALNSAGDDGRVALLGLLRGSPPEIARKHLEAHESVRAAVEALGPDATLGRRS